jgi:vacuolar-type H+-ATPase subunit H
MEAEKGLLQEIRKTEEECCTRTEEARQYAEQTIAEAQAESERILARAEQEGKEAAQQYSNTEMGKLRREIEVLREEAAVERTRAIERGEENIPDAVRQILEAVASE